MRKNKNKIHSQNAKASNQSGFTLIEVTLVLAITGLMLIGLVGGSFSSIARQRYNDAVRGFGEYMSGMYNTVIRPESLGAVGDVTYKALGNSRDQAILGKVLVFGGDYPDYTDDDKRAVWSATLVGSTDILRSSNNSFIQELASSVSNVSLVCGAKENGNVTQISSVETYFPLWETYLQPTNAQNNSIKFKGTMIIARTPTSAIAHTAFVKDLTYDLKTRCTPDNSGASGDFVTDLIESAAGRLPENYTLDVNTVICVKATDVGALRAVQIDGNGSNSSAVKILSEADSSTGNIRCN